MKRKSLFSRSDASNMNRSFWEPATVLTLLALGSMPGYAQDGVADQPSAENVEGTMTETEKGIPAVDEPPLWDKVWGAMEFYKNDENKVIQSVKFTGRFQADYAHVRPTSYYDVLIRRFRLGFKTTWFHDWTLHAEVDLAPEDDSVYKRLTDAYISWSKTGNLELTIGKHGAPFTLDGATSSKKLLSIDRSNVSNNMWFTQEYFPGVSASGAPNNWRYHAGVYSTGNDQREFGHFDGRAFVLGSIGYDFSENMENAENSTVSANYVYNWQDAGNASTRALEQVATLSYEYGRDKWGVRSELTGAKGFLGQSDLWGAQVMPYYDVTKQFQVVARYTYVTSKDPNGVRFARYENRVVSGRGDEYNEFYLGLNYYFYGHKLKVQTGVDYADMKDAANTGAAYSGWAWTTGFRLSW